jgi:hypothetical protein
MNPLRTVQKPVQVSSNRTICKGNDMIQVGHVVYGPNQAQRLVEDFV